MALGREAERIKQELQRVVLLRRELIELEHEWRDLLDALEDSLTDPSSGCFEVAQAVAAQRMALRRRLTEAQLRGWARIRSVPLSALQRRVMGLRYVRGCAWSDVIAQVGKAKQYLLREHNKALEVLAQAEKTAAKKE